MNENGNNPVGAQGANPAPCVDTKNKFDPETGAPNPNYIPPNDGTQTTDSNEGYTYAADNGGQQSGYTQYNYNNPQSQPQPGSNPPGYGEAVASMVLGIVAVVFWFFGWSAIVSVILGVVGVILASKSKTLGYAGPMRTAGFVLSIIGMAGGVIFFVSCIACVGCVSAAAPYGYFYNT